MVMNVDFESRSPIDLRKAGVYAYSEDPDTDIWCMSYAFGDEEPQTWLPGEPVPQRVKAHVEEGGEIRAWNAQFERVMWWVILTPRYGFPRPAAEQFVCTAAEARAMGLPGSLGWCAQVLKVEEEKDDEGRRLMIKMARPIKRKGKKLRSPYEWHDDPADISRLGLYCEQDVRTERAIMGRLMPLPPAERAVYLLDQLVNDRGIRVDLDLVAALMERVKKETAEANARLAELTDGAVTAVTQTARLRDWCNYRFEEAGVLTGEKWPWPVSKAGRLAPSEVPVEDETDPITLPLYIPGVAADVVREVLLRPDIPTDVREALEIRQDAGKTSPGKLKAMVKGIGRRDDRARGLLLYHGAATGRWSGMRVQPQNFPRPDLKNPEAYIPEVLSSGFIPDDVSAMSVITSLLRSCFVASEGNRLVAADFSQIEARVTHWFAGQPWEDNPYERMAGFIYDKPWEEINKDSDERQIGKNTVLGAGFGMGWEKFIDYVYAATGVRISEEEARKAITKYREKNHHVQQFWSDIEAAARYAVVRPGEIGRCGVGGEVQYLMSGAWLLCRLPSGRALAYANPKIVMRKTPWGQMRPSLTAMGINTYTRKWSRNSLYGGLLTENVVQATARDLMVAGMARIERAGYPVVLTVHDEIIADVPEGHGSLEEFEALMAHVPAWARGVPVEVEGWEGERWRK